MTTEQKQQDDFVKAIGGTKRANRLQALYQYWMKIREFKDLAKHNGYTDKEIDMFLALP